MRLGITAKAEIPEAIRVARRVLSLLESEDVVMERGLANVFGKKGVTVEEMKDIDVLITVGGDGTMLRSLQRNKAPIFGVNAGMLGFLTEISEENQIEEGIKRLLSGNYFIDERIKVKTLMSGRRLYDGMNEAVVHTAHIAKIRNFHVFIDDQLAMDVRADGIIVATPTGSTSYSMSVGGPIIDQRMEAFVIAPMAPFRNAARPIVVPASSVIRLELAKLKPCLLVIDGQVEEDMQGDEVIEFSLSENKGKFVTFNRDFYARLNEKLMCVP